MVDTLTKPINIDTADNFWIENHSNDKTLRLRYARYPYEIGPGKKKIVPFEVVQLYFGDPRSQVGVAVPYADSRGKGVVPERYSEVSRLAIMYGVYQQGEEDIAGAIEVENRRLADIAENRFDPVRPLIADNFFAVVTDLEGNRIIPPLFDRDGKYTYGFGKDEQSSDDLATIIAQLKRRVDYLETASEVLDEKGDNIDDGIAIDNPEGP